MRSILIIYFVLISTFIACKASEKKISKTASETTVTTSASNPLNTQQTKNVPKATGKVSHQFRATGCATVIIVKGESEENDLILIPRDKLEAKNDVDGLEISFNYLMLRMPNPPGCNAGIPAEITNISSKKK